MTGVKRRATLATAAGLLLSMCFPARAQDDQLFTRLAGRWTGAGVARVLNGGDEPLRCRAEYIPFGPSRIHLAIACASASFKLEVTSELARRDDGVAGTWREASYGVSGTVSGHVGRDRIDATVTGMGLSARLTLAIHGRSQAVTLASQGQLPATAAVTLWRQ